MEHSTEYKIPSYAQSRKDLHPGVQDVKKKQLVLAHCQNHSRTHQLCFLCRTTGETTLQVYPNRGQSATRRTQEQELSTATLCKTRTPMVARKYREINTNSLQRSHDIYNYRRVRSRMGSDSKRQVSKRLLERRPTIMAQQPERAMDTEKSPSNYDVRMSRSNCFGTDRQQDSRRLHQQGRGNEVFGSIGYDDRYTSGSSSQSGSSHCALPAREIQSTCRQSVQISTDARVDSVSVNSGNNIQQVRYPNDRSVRELAVGSCGSICIRRCTGPELCVCKRVQQTVALPARLGFSSTASHTSSITTPTKELRKISAGGATMGENLLEIGTQSKSFESANENLQPASTLSRSTDGETTAGRRQTRFAGMDGTGWAHLVESWQETDKTLLESAWRKSTLKTYGSAWDKWLAWSKGKCKVDDPEPGDLAKFLCFLHTETKLAPSTIAVHKSVVSTFANPVRSDALSGHPLVKQMMKAISLTKPPPRKPSTWDIGRLIEYLQQYNLDADSIFQVSRHVAALLLLCSGRRIHDLTLLDIGSKFFEDANDYVVLWPKFGSKTDSSTYRQAGWRLSNDGPEKLNPVVWIKKLICVTEQRRTARPNLSTLFITTRGKVNAASRTVIAGWLRTLLQEANIQDSPGSFRAAVNSDMWLNHHINIDEILARGNWRSKYTFIKYYFKEARPNESTSINIRNNLFSSFAPV